MSPLKRKFSDALEVTEDPNLSGNIKVVSDRTRHKGGQETPVLTPVLSSSSLPSTGHYQALDHSPRPLKRTRSEWNSDVEQPTMPPLSKQPSHMNVAEPEWGDESDEEEKWDEEVELDVIAEEELDVEDNTDRELIGMNAIPDVFKAILARPREAEPCESQGSSADENAEAGSAPPSPVPTEIIEVIEEKTQEEHTADLAGMGIKVRDFAYESISTKLRAPEVWRNPLYTLSLHDTYIRASPARREVFKLPGKMLRRLLDLNWVTQEEAQLHWTELDWADVRQHDARENVPHPYLQCPPSRKPARLYRNFLRTNVFNPAPDDLPEEDVYMPPDEPWMDHGPGDKWLEALTAAEHGQNSSNAPTEIATEGQTTPPTSPSTSSMPAPPPVQAMPSQSPVQPMPPQPPVVAVPPQSPVQRPPPPSPVQGAPVSSLVQRAAPQTVAQRTPPQSPVQCTPPLSPLQRTPPQSPSQRTPSLSPLQRTPPQSAPQHTPTTSPAQRIPTTSPTQETPSTPPVQQVPLPALGRGLKRQATMRIIR